MSVISSVLDTDVELDDDTIETTATYQITDTKIQGMIDELAALRQFISKALSTEKYEYPIYSLDYGLQTSDLIGKDADYVESELERRITEVLEDDERINQVDNFQFTASGENLLCTFDVASIYGDMTIEKEVAV